MIPFPIHFSPPHLVCCPGEQTAMVESMRSHAQGAGPISSRGNLHRSCRVFLAALPSLSFSSSLISPFHDVPAWSLSLLIWFFAVCLNFTLLTGVHRPTHMLSKAGYVISLRPLVRDQLGNQLGPDKGWTSRGLRVPVSICPGPSFSARPERDHSRASPRPTFRTVPVEHCRCCCQE